MPFQNITQNLNASDLGGILVQANTNTGDSFWTGIYWMITAVIFFASINFGWEVAVILAFFGGMIAGMFLLYLGLISILVFGMSEAILLFVIIYLMATSNRSN